MEAIARVAAHRPVAVTVLAAVFVVLGWVSWRGLPLDLLPDVQSPTVLVSVSSGERPAVESLAPLFESEYLAMAKQTLHR